MKGVTLPTETVFVMEMSPIKFGLGAMDEIAYDVRRFGLGKVLIVTDRNVAELGLPARVAALLGEEGIKSEIYDGSEVEPTDRSMEEAAEHARQKDFDGLIAVGGGSSIDTCKAVNLLTCYPAPIRDYINKPVGKGIPVPGPLKPMIAVPTTAGTGSETTAAAITHLLDDNVKAGVSHRLLRPALGVVDPLNTLTAPPEVTAAAGCDILTHAIESYTTRPYDARPKYFPPDRPVYVGANPASDIWCEKAIEYVSKYLRRAVLNGLDLEARVHLALAATYAGLGFGNAGVHVPHAIAYPIAGQVRDFVPSGYRTQHPLVPHGMSVVLTAPSTFRFTYASAPERHLRAAQLMDVDVNGLPEAQRREALPRALIALMRDIGIPNGISAVGYGEHDLPALIDGTLKQPRLLAGAPRAIGAQELDSILRDSMRYW
ncbi:MAG: iron-containing alcohol dehydrogenase [Candidatus Rokubacteria bacterium]|nr:iron-containing alcohol dehydrogenase [Candidatus Rokubacteria bacterium]